MNFKAAFENCKRIIDKNKEHEFLKGIKFNLPCTSTVEMVSSDGCIIIACRVPVNYNAITSQEVYKTGLFLPQKEIKNIKLKDLTTSDWLELYPDHFKINGVKVKQDLRPELAVGIYSPPDYSKFIPRDDIEVCLSQYQIDYLKLRFKPFKIKWDEKGEGEDVLEFRIDNKEKFLSINHYVTGYNLFNTSIIDDRGVKKVYSIYLSCYYVKKILQSLLYNETLIIRFQEDKKEELPPVLFHQGRGKEFQAILRPIRINKKG